MKSVTSIDIDSEKIDSTDLWILFTSVRRFQNSRQLILHIKWLVYLCAVESVKPPIILRRHNDRLSAGESDDLHLRCSENKNRWRYRERLHMELVVRRQTNRKHYNILIEDSILIENLDKIDYIDRCWLVNGYFCEASQMFGLSDADLGNSSKKKSYIGWNK